MKELTAKEIYEKLLDQQILSKKGFTSINFLDVNCNNVDPDTLGKQIELWLGKWFEKNKIFSSPDQNSQEPPDFYLKSNDNKCGLLQIKAFYASPAFDISSWDAYLNLLLQKPYHIDADYLIFDYDIKNNNEYFFIENIFLKKIWEISRSMGKTAKIPFPINVQYKNGTITNIRPVGTSDLKLKHSPHFKNKKEFLEAMQKTIEIYPKSRSEHKNGKWLQDVKEKYFKIFKKQIY